MKEDEIIIYKNLGETPLEAIKRYKKLYPQLQDEPLTYAGRLDPMAEGLLLALKGDAIKHKESYLNLTKTYQASILFGFKTDSLDILGLSQTDKNFTMDNGNQLQRVIDSLIGKHNWPVPAFSSKPVNGRAMFEWAKLGKLDEIDIPQQTFEVYEIITNRLGWLYWQDIYPEIIRSISLVNGDFRQKEILAQWSQVSEQVSWQQKIAKLDLTISCSSGTYIRSIAEQIGKKLGQFSMLYKLKRTRVGEFRL